MGIEGYQKMSYYDIENMFFHSEVSIRINKLIAHYELYKKIIDLPGEIVECGVMKGVSLIGFCCFREMLESRHSRKIIGFDTFGRFPIPKSISEEDKRTIMPFIQAAGDAMSETSLDLILKQKGFFNYELVKGDIFATLPDYFNRNPSLRIAFLHIDVDLYEPTREVLSRCYERVVPGGIVACDDYALAPGASKAIDEFLLNNTCVQLQKLPFAHKPAYWIKR